MPELPEVETARKFVHQLCSGAQIVRVHTREQGQGPRHGLFDDLVFEDCVHPSVLQAMDQLHSSKDSPKEAVKKSNKRKADHDEVTVEGLEGRYQDALLHRTVAAVKRKGKQMWFEFDDKFKNLAVLFHFGMTGSFVIRDHAIPTYKSFKIVTREEWPPKFTKLELEFSNGIHIAFCDPRRMGRIKLRLDPLQCDPIMELGLDPSYDKLPSPAELQATFQAYSTSIKALLLDQEKVFCGIGNYLADEVLYQSGIHPETRACDINIAGCQKLLEKLDYIIQTAIEVDAKYEDFPRDWLFHYRWDKVKANGGEKIKMPDGNAIIFETCGGRTSAIVPAMQPTSGYYLTKVSKSSVTTTVAKKKGISKVKLENIEAKEESSLIKEEKISDAVLTVTTKTSTRKVKKEVDDLNINHPPSKRSKAQQLSTHTLITSNVRRSSRTSTK